MEIGIPVWALNSAISDFRMHVYVNAKYFKMAENTNVQPEEKNNETKGLKQMKKLFSFA